MKPISYDKYYWQNELVRLRAGTFEDWEEAYPSRFDSEARFLLQEEIELPPAESTVQEESRRFAGFSPETRRLMFTIETLDGTAVGGLNLNSINERNGTFSIGMEIWVGYRGKGYGTAAMRIVLGYAFLERRLNKFNVWCVEGNVASIAMMKKLGCTQEGVMRQILYSGGRYLDGIPFGLTKDEFVESERESVRGTDSRTD